MTEDRTTRDIARRTTFQTFTHAFYATAAFAVAAAALTDGSAPAAIAELAMVVCSLILVGVAAIYTLAFTSAGRRFDRFVTARVSEVLG